MEPLDYCSNFLIGGYNSDGSTRLYSLVEEDELLASIRGRIMKKIALINPPFRGVIHRIKDAYPLGLGYIKAYCESKGVVCDLYDFSCSLLSDQALEEKYCLSDYDVIGVSSYSLFFSDTVVLIELLKKDRNIIVVGGHHATLCGSKILRDFPVIDFCLKGFGEKSFYDFISNIDTENVYSVSGLCYRKGDEFIDNPVNYEGIDINEFPVPDRGDIIVDASNYEFDATKRVFHISTSRGCPYHCTYCVNCKNNYWLARSELNVLEELNREFRGKGYKYINFVDCNFYVNPSRAESLIARIRKEYPGVKFSFQTRSDQVANNKGQLEKLLSAGDCSITLGIESNSAQVLKRYRKETTPDINQNAIDFLKQTQSQTLVYMIMFEALESLDDIRASFDFLKNNDLLDYATVGNIYQTLVPFYGSHYYDDYHDYYIGSIFEKNGGALIYEILPRKSTLSRKVSGNQMREQIIAANIDLVCVCLSIREGIRLSVVNRLLFGFSGNFRQMLLLTQSDLCEDPTNEVALIKRDLPGVVIQDVCAIRDDLSSVLGPFLRSGETMALVGPSGVGKSTIINSLLGYEKQITSTYSIKSNKGRHTTTSRTLHYCSKLGAWAIDTPGIKELSLWNVEKTPELFQHIYELAKECRFSNCSHIQEPGCRIKKALEDGTITRSEYEAFLKLERERQMVIATKRMCLRKKR